MIVLLAVRHLPPRKAARSKELIRKIRVELQWIPSCFGDMCATTPQKTLGIDMLQNQPKQQPIQHCPPMCHMSAFASWKSQKHSHLPDAHASAPISLWPACRADIHTSCAQAAVGLPGKGQWQQHARRIGSCSSLQRLPVMYMTALRAGLVRASMTMQQTGSQLSLKKRPLSVKASVTQL